MKNTTVETQFRALWRNTFTINRRSDEQNCSKVQLVPETRRCSISTLSLCRTDGSSALDSMSFCTIELSKGVVLSLKDINPTTALICIYKKESKINEGKEKLRVIDASPIVCSSLDGIKFEYSEETHPRSLSHSTEEVLGTGETFIEWIREAVCRVYRPLSALFFQFYIYTYIHEDSDWERERFLALCVCAFDFLLFVVEVK